MSTFVRITNDTGTELLLNTAQIQFIAATKDSNICHVYMVGEADSEQYFVAMHPIEALAYLVDAKATWRASKDSLEKCIAAIRDSQIKPTEEPKQ